MDAMLPLVSYIDLASVSSFSVSVVCECMGRAGLEREGQGELKLRELLRRDVDEPRRLFSEHSPSSLRYPQRPRGSVWAWKRRSKGQQFGAQPEWWQKDRLSAGTLR